MVGVLCRSQGKVFWLKTILNLHYKKCSRSFMQYNKFEPQIFVVTCWAITPDQPFFCWLNIAKIKYKKIKLLKSCGFLSFSTMLYLYMVQVSSQKYKRMFKEIYFHIWLVAKSGYIFLWIIVTLAVTQKLQKLQEKKRHCPLTHMVKFWFGFQARMYM